MVKFLKKRLKLSFYFHLLRRPNMIRKYLEKNSVRKLQIGCQNAIIEGWLNTDLIPRNRKVAYLDATKKFPIKDQTFDYIFSEHMIEHIPYKRAQFMLKECYRILKIGGRIRISTPNLEFIASVYFNNSKDVMDYINFSGKYLEDMPVSRTTIINNFFYNWGHCFIYDFNTLKDIIEEAGFSHIICCKPGESQVEFFSGIERHQNHIGKFNELESMVLEGIKQN